jgi:hypothetical protein
MIHIRVDRDSNGKCTVTYVCIEPPEDENLMDLYNDPRISYRYKQHFKNRFSLFRTSRFLNYPLHLPSRRRKRKPFNPTDYNDTDPTEPQI